MSFLTLLLCVIYVGSGFLGLLLHRMKFRYYLSIICNLFLLYTVFGPLMGQYITLPFVLISLTIVYLGCNRNIWDVIFSLMGYLLATLANHICSIPLSLLGITLEEISTKYPCTFLLAVIAITLGLQFLVKKYFLLPKMTFLQECPRKLQWIFLLQLLVCVGLIAVNFIYGENVGYPTEVLTFNGIIISIFTVFTIILFYSLYQILQENYKLKLRQREQEMMKDYTERIEGLYEDFRIFRHDYKNILSTLGYYIEEKDVERLQTYFQEKILPSGDILSSDRFAIGKLHLVEIPSVKSILYSKLLTALNKDISVTLEITEPLAEVSMDELDLSRILGILIDNSIEAALLTEDKLLTIAIVITNDAVLFSFVNSCPPPTVPLSTLSERGYTTKNDHDGLGLYTVQNIVDSLDNVSFTMQYDGLFRQVLEVMKQ